MLSNEGIGCACGWPLDRCMPEYAKGESCGRERHEASQAPIPKSDSPARPDELRWTITKGAGQSGAGFYAIDGPDIRRMEVIPAQVTDEMVVRVADVLETVRVERMQPFSSDQFRYATAQAVLRAAFSTKDTP